MRYKKSDHVPIKERERRKAINTVSLIKNLLKSVIETIIDRQVAIRSPFVKNHPSRTVASCRNQRSRHRRLLLPRERHALLIVGSVVQNRSLRVASGSEKDNEHRGRSLQNDNQSARRSRTRIEGPERDTYQQRDEGAVDEEREAIRALHGAITRSRVVDDHEELRGIQRSALAPPCATENRKSEDDAPR